MNSNEKQQVVYPPEGVRRQSRLPIRAVIFDFGGVVYKEVMGFIYEDTGKRFGIEPSVVRDESKQLQAEWQKNKITSEEFWRRLASNLKIVDVQALKEVWDKTFVEHTAPNEKTIEIIKKLKANGYEVVVLSNTIEPHAAYHKLKKNFDLFSFVFLSFEIGMRKPDRELYEYVLKQLNVHPEQCLFVDDSEKNVLAAEEVGMHAIHFKNAEQLEAELKKLEIL
jgi:epoxide hydrolase-like predicted phosphatase